MPDHPNDNDAGLADDDCSPDGPNDVTDATPGIGWTLVDGEPTRTQVLYLDDEAIVALQLLHRDRVLRRKRRAQLRQFAQLLRMGHASQAGSTR